MEHLSSENTGRNVMQKERRVELIGNDQKSVINEF
jgi:hypothetical protein